MSNLVELFNQFSGIITKVADTTADYPVNYGNKSRVFNDLLKVSLRGTNKYCFTIKNEGGAYATFVCPLHNNGEFSYIPPENERKYDKVEVLLHWGLNPQYLEDFTSWGHNKCSYKIIEVPYSVVSLFKEEQISNYWCLYDTIVNYSITSVWEVAE